MKIHFVVVVIIIPPVIGVLTADIKKKKKKNPQNFNFTSEDVLMGNMTSKIFLLILGEKECFKMMLYHILNNQIS